MQIKDIQNARYTLNGRIFFDSNVGNIEMSAKDALEISYILFDSVGIDYKVLDEISEKLEEM